MTATGSLLPATQAAPSRNAFADAWITCWEQTRAQFVDGAQVVLSLRRSGVSRWSVFLAVAWVIGIVGDAATTVVMIRLSVAVEGNPAAAGLMGLVGVEGWAVVASALCAALAVGSLGRARGLFARFWVVSGVVVAALKVWFAVTNTLLWVNVAG